MEIDLRSDTVTRPTKAMLDAMFTAKVGDDVFGDDPTVNELEEKVAKLFGKESAIFCPSGTMTNQIAVKVHTQPGDEIICEAGSHVYNFEGGGIGFNSGCSMRLIFGDRGRIFADQILANINPVDVHRPRTRLVVAENTSNKGGGSIYDFKELKKISEVCKKNELRFHLDGARLFNALVETQENPIMYGQLFDSISICFSKGLGAPIGSILLCNKTEQFQARRIRKVLGGGMRQAGYLAAAGIYALENNIQRLREDHLRARQLGETISNLPFVEDVMPVETNIIIFKVNKKIRDLDLITKLKEKGILVVGFGPQLIRMVTHLDFNDDMLDRTKRILRNII
ncbi:MAG: aminotransferase class I/II-fold pyridoxal phosphate-dependent enzyme [Bacteroidetes bacterium]|nr:aminotransferase class I/II-fold pyridoxal phosphate-dependent enzyme [Bacteroidota bacterium]